MGGGQMGCELSSTPMRLVALADTHSYHAALTVPDGDVLVHAGDMTRLGT